MFDIQHGGQPHFQIHGFDGTILRFFSRFMNTEYLEYQLSKGNSFGYNFLENVNIVSWLLISKRINVHNFLKDLSHLIIGTCIKSK